MDFLGLGYCRGRISFGFVMVAARVAAARLGALEVSVLG